MHARTTGRLQAGIVDPAGRFHPHGEPCRNAILPTSILLVAHALFTGEKRANGMLLEYGNTGEFAISEPAFDADDIASGADYYTGLAESAIDYVRAPIVAANVDEDEWAASPTAVQTMVTAIAAAGTGVHGSPFSNAAGSRVIGGAIAWLHPDDPTQDIVYSRGYFTAETQLEMPEAGQLAVRWFVRNTIR